jgi:hypothetical protein
MQVPYVRSCESGNGWEKARVNGTVITWIIILAFVLSLPRVRRVRSGNNMHGAALGRMC